MIAGPAAAWNGTMGDRDLVDRCVRGDRRAWSELFRRYEAKILPADEDLRQEVWARLIEKNALSRLRLERSGALDAWFARVAVRVAVDQQRHRRARPREEPFHIEPRESSLDPEMAAMRAEERRAISGAIDRTARNRDLMVLRLHLVDGMGPTEIAASGIGLSPKGVASLLRRTVSRLAPEVARGRPPEASESRRAAGNRRRGP
ncbi:MAG: RNA polymerase sigma factor [Myxococcales bacterium]